MSIRLPARRLLDHVAVANTRPGDDGRVRDLLIDCGMQTFRVRNQDHAQTVTGTVRLRIDLERRETLVIVTDDREHPIGRWPLARCLFDGLEAERFCLPYHDVALVL